MGERPGEIGRYERKRYPDEPEVVVSEVEVVVVRHDPQDRAEIRAEIAGTRTEMTNAIQERLNPQHLREQAKETGREQLGEPKDYMYDATIGRAERTAKGAG